VTPETTDHAETVLRDEGYAALPEVSPGYTRKYENCRRYVLANQLPGAVREFSIGLHWGLTHYPYFDPKLVDIPQLFQRARPLQVTGVNVLELSFEDELVYTCGHLALHHRNAETLLNYFEIASIIQNGGTALDWHGVCQRAGAWRYGVQVQNTLQQVNWLWPGLIPAAAMEQVRKLHPSWKERWLDWVVAKTQGNNFRCAVVEWLTIPGLSAKWALTFRSIFPDKAYMQTWYGGDPSPKLFKLYAERFMKGLRGIFQYRPG